MIRLEQVTKCYRRGAEEFTALQAATLHLTAGSSTLITGPNGAGKSTLLRLMGGLIRPTTGRIYCDGEEISGLTEPFRSGFRLHHLGVHFQGDTLLEGLSIFENITLAALPELTDMAAHRARVAGLLAQMRLEVDAEVTVEQLSGGQRQKVCLARALINDPPVVLADEPTNHLDADSAAELRTLLLNLQNEGRTVAVVSHDPLFPVDKFTRHLRVDDGVVTDGAM